MPSEDEATAQSVEQHGWHCITISDIDPPFLYTIGLMRTFEHPELILFGLDRDAAYSVARVMVENLRAGSSYAQSGRYDGVLEGHPVGIRPVHPSHHERYLGYAMGYCRRHIGRIGELQAVQVYWPDDRGRFPFEPNCELHVYNAQPRLDVPLTPSEIDEFHNDW